MITIRSFRQGTRQSLEARTHRRDRDERNGLRAGIEVKRGEQIRFVLHIEAEKADNGYVVTRLQKAK
jgi:hypothetical protein